LYGGATVKTIINRIKEDVAELEKVKQRKRELEHRLTDNILENSQDINLLDALFAGIVKMNFAVPPKFYKVVAEMERERD
jgi:F0F1-type ATP synthase delta subunit